MKCAIAMSCVLIFLVTFTFGKEDVVYELKGGDVFDLIRGIQPKDGSLKVTKVEDRDDGKLPDGIFFIPEDDALGDKPNEVKIKNKPPQGQ